VLLLLRIFCPTALTVSTGERIEVSGFVQFVSRLGGKPGLHDTSVGETTRYVVNKAPCRVILTAPPAKKALDPMGPWSKNHAAPRVPEKSFRALWGKNNAGN